MNLFLSNNDRYSRGISGLDEHKTAGSGKLRFEIFKGISTADSIRSPTIFLRVRVDTATVLLRSSYGSFTEQARLPAEQFRGKSV